MLIQTFSEFDTLVNYPQHMLSLGLYWPKNSPTLSELRSCSIDCTAGDKRFVRWLHWGDILC
eukprot:scaffold2430_cov277-Chaetoceros_neogracile.AAC.1